MPLAYLRSALLLTLLGLVSCASTSTEVINQRRAEIAAEAPGDYYIGRRFRIDRTHFWGYLRKPQQQWENSKLVVINERVARQPDRLPEEPSAAVQTFGFDHNYEYRIWGNYTGRRVYDPNSDLALPEFQLTRYQLIKPAAGWLFKPNERFNGFQLLRAEPTSVP